VPTPGTAEYVAVPDLFGLSQADAEAALADLGLQLGRVTVITPDALPPGVDITVVDIGQVFIQAPAPGTKVPRGSPVSIAVRGE
jgi:beta-lactam-binding protein with PASTA domain